MVVKLLIACKWWMFPSLTWRSVRGFGKIVFLIMLSAQEDTTKIKESVRYFYINYSVNIIIVKQNQIKIFFLTG